MTMVKGYRPTPSGSQSSQNNSSSTPLGAAASFVGTTDDVSAYPENTINLYGEPAIAPGTLFFEYSPDGINWDVSVSYALAGPQSFVPLPLRNVLTFFRVRYINGATPLTAFRLTTTVHFQPPKMLTRVVNQSIDENEPVEMVRNINAGKSPDGPYTNLPATGVVSSQSTNAPLGIGGIFLGSQIVSTLGYLAASVSVISNVSSAVDGLEFLWYADLAGTRPLGMTTFTYGNAPDLTSVQVPVKGPYFRIRYTNNAIAQTSFELVTSLIITAPPPDVLPISSTITGNNAAQIVKANIVGQQENGIYANSKLSNSSSQMVAIADRPSEVRGRTRVVIPLNRTALVAGGTDIYTVTIGKILYISAFSFSALNDSIAVGEWRLRDNAAVRAAYIMAPRAGAVPDAAASSSPTLPEPMPFSTSVNLIEITGSIEVSGFLIGYEE